MKKVLLLMIIVLLSGCSIKYSTNMSHQDMINMNINSDNNLYNVNNKGYKYYMPTGFSVFSDKDYNQTFLSYGNYYYLYVDVISYYYKKDIVLEKSNNDYEFYEFTKDDKVGYLKITKNNNYFFVELCYNYAIIEVEVEEVDIDYAVSRGISILNSIKYNDTVIGNAIGNKEIDSSETIYNIPSPENKKSDKNVLEWIEEDENNSEDDDTDVEE